MYSKGPRARDPNGSDCERSNIPMLKNSKAVINRTSKSSFFTKNLLYIVPILVLLIYPFISNFMFRALSKAKMSTKAPLNPRDFPRPPLCERTPRHLQIKWDGTLIADTKEAYWVLETTHPPSMSPANPSLPFALQNNILSSCADPARPSNPDSFPRQYSNPSLSVKNIVNGLRSIRETYLTFASNKLAEY